MSSTTLDPISVEPARNHVSREHVSSTSPFFLWMVLLLIAAGGIVLRIHLLTTKDFWDDEAASVIFAQLPWRSFLKTIWNYEANMSLYYVLLRAWMRFGDNEASVRFLSVLFGVAVIPGIYFLGKRLFGEKEGIVSAALSAVNMFQIRYSQEARGYSLVMLLSVLSTYCLLKAMDAPRRKGFWIGYVALSALGVYAHIFFFLVVLAQWLSFGRIRLRIHLKEIVWTTAGFMLLTSPMILFLLTKNQGQIDWLSRPTMKQLLDFAELFTGYGGSVLLAIYGALCLIAVFTAYKDKRGKTGIPQERWGVNLVAAWLMFPIISTLLVSFVRPIFSDRFMAISAPALVLLAGRGIVELDRLFPRLRTLFPASLALVALLSLWGIRRYGDGPAAKGDHWQLVTRYILTNQQAGDAAFFYRASGGRSFAYYAKRETEERGSTPLPVIIFPSHMNIATEFIEDPNKEQVGLASAGHKRIWMIQEHWKGSKPREVAMQEILDTLQKDHRIAEEQTFPGATGAIHVLLYVQSRDSEPVTFSLRETSVQVYPSP